jgi:positive regulator of sigma E activity
MYVIPLIFVILLALIATAWTPIFALMIAVPLFLAFLVYVGMRRRSDETTEQPVGPAGTAKSDDTHTGIWGEPRP